MRRCCSLLVAGLTGMALLTGIGSSAQAAVACDVQYSVANQWQSGFQGSLVIKNLGDAWNGWTLTFTFTNGQAITQGWGGVFTSSGSDVTVRNETWNGNVPTGASASPGFIGSWTGSNNPPTSFAVNGVTCGGVQPTSSTTTTTRPTTSTTTTTRPTTTTTSTTTTTTTTSTGPTGTPVGINGQLRVCGTNLCNQYGKPIQLRGMSTHGIQWFPQCINDASLDALANDWKADLLRVSMYVQEQGYETNPALFTDRVNTYVDMATARGMYAIIDFHTLTPGDPNYNLNNARTFFAAVAARHANKNNVIYEIANEPNGVSWAQIKSYAEQVIPVIRNADPDAIVIVGTRAWSSLGVSEGGNENEVINSPVNAGNVMYAFHFYAASHGDNYRQTLSRAAARIPMFVTEFGTVTYTGDGGVDQSSSTAWFNLMDSLKVSYANWTFSDHTESSAAFKAGTCSGSNYAGTSVLKESGILVRSRIMTSDNFPTS